MKRLIFLDIDGVLNSEEFFAKRAGLITADEYIDGKGNIDPKAVQLLNKLQGASIVISSSWGDGGGKTEELLKLAGLALPIEGYTKKLHYKHEWACRGNEIEHWIDQNTDFHMGTKWGSEYLDKDFAYVILDDDCDMLLGQKDNFIRVDRWRGLTEENIEKAMEILKIGVDDTNLDT